MSAPRKGSTTLEWCLGPGDGHQHWRGSSWHPFPATLGVPGEAGGRGQVHPLLWPLHHQEGVHGPSAGAFFGEEDRTAVPCPREDGTDVGLAFGQRRLSRMRKSQRDLSAERVRGHRGVRQGLLLGQDLRRPLMQDTEERQAAGGAGRRVQDCLSSQHNLAYPVTGEAARQGLCKGSLHVLLDLHPLLPILGTSPLTKGQRSGR